MQLNEAIQAGLESVRRNSLHVLSPYHRNLIYSCIGSLSLPKSRCVRIQLAIIAAKKVLPLWNEARSDDPRVQEIIDIATALSGQNIPTEVAKGKARESWAWLVNDYGDRKEELTSKAFFALATALEALYISLGIDRFLNVEIDENTTDGDLDPWCSDAAKYAAIAYTGQVGEENSSPAKQAFWEWWLTEGIPNALVSCHSEGSTSYNSS